MIENRDNPMKWNNSHAESYILKGMRIESYIQWVKRTQTQILKFLLETDRVTHFEIGRPCGSPVGDSLSWSI
jgi:hypothetical protein